ncbi:carboxymuconolactone decarboxylase family protein [Ornithinimicrobium sp. Y1694]|uniref:carboxymuconolactone decarboxylase family protein n=1 Tax=Ornithinimicrobium sp. Y1694 TaxID=3418590 RepID=UPI003CFAD5E3
MALLPRIPAHPSDDLLARVLMPLARRTFGQVPDSARVLWHHRRAAVDLFLFELRVARWRSLDPTLKSLAVMASAGQIGCSWCVDFAYYAAHAEGLDTQRISQVPRWRESEAFTELERQVMAYAEAMTATPPTTSDEQVARLSSALGHRAFVELTLMVALENQRSRVNAAMGLTSQGYSDACPVPLAEATSPSARA